MTDHIDTAVERAKLAALVGHTPGPWNFKRAAGVSNDIGIIGGGGCVAECFEDIRRYNECAVTEQIGNANLIAAAPDMKATLAIALDEIDRLREVLGWYGEQARLARLIHSEGEDGRLALAADGGGRARAALRNTEASHDD